MSIAVAQSPSTTIAPQGTTAVTVTKAVPAEAISAPAQDLPRAVFAGEPAPGSPEAKAADDKQAARLQKIQQLSFDRRPSAILHAWAGLDPDDAGKTAGLPGAGAPTAEPPRPRPTSTAQTEPDPFDAELKRFAREVTLGRWEAVRTYLAKPPEAEGKALYKRLLEALPGAPQGNPGMPPGMAMNMPMNPQWMERNAIAPLDVIGLSAAAPHGRDDDAVAALGRLLATSLEQGHAVEDFLARARAELERPEAVAALTRREAARILVAANRADEAGAFLPDAARAEADDDREALNLLAQHYLALHAKKKKVEYLEHAWGVLQAALASGKVEPKQRDEALTRAVELAPKLKAELGQRWLEESFAKRPERGMEILAVIGTATAQGLQSRPMDPDFRQKSLELQKTAVEALLSASPERAEAWRDTLALLAGGWLAEADFSRQFDMSTTRGPQMQRDAFGNYYYGVEDAQRLMMMQQQNMPRAIAVGELLKVQPGQDWVAHLPASLAPRHAQLMAQLLLKVGEEDEAFPHIERLAATHPEPARALAEEFLRVWTENHDPNANRNRTNYYMFMFGFERRAEGIPLTRSKQERNLVELSDWVRRLRALPIGDLDEQLLARAFTNCHSSAEVYRLDAIESIFGSIDGLKPETLAALIQQMRGNLAGLWRMPAEQEKQKTRRREQDIRAEVLRGYEVARSVIDRALEQHPDAWSLVLARAALQHDENNYRQEIEPGPEFTGRRQDALADFARAAELYGRRVPALAEDEETTEPFDLWYYASLGACDLGQVREKHVPDRKQPPLIRATLEGLPGEAAKRHRAMFANNLFTRMSAANPAVKFRYLEAGFAIIGDHPQAVEARKVFDYYKDLVTEIQLETVLDGPDVVGHAEPFGVFVNLRHTRDIERESGGFGRYLQNQNSGMMFYYNYGRPLENYRDKFEEAARAALQEQFDVLSVTFHAEDVHSRAAEPFGWRITPYAYLLLKARSPKVDRLPPVRLDLDFLDTSGYVVLPVESPALPIDARPETTPARPFRDLKLTQILDERQAADGRLVVEIKATASGLVPKLDEILDARAEGFEVVETEDQGLSVTQFDPDGPGDAVTSERNWLVTLRGADDPAAAPAVFRFPAAKVETAELVRQRYVDADLEEVAAEVPLAGRYAQANHAWLWWLAGGLLLAALGLFAAWRLRRRRPRARLERFPVPEPLTPFSLLGYLRTIEENDGLALAQRQDLAQQIQRLERHFFDEPTSTEPDLRTIAETWSSRTR